MRLYASDGTFFELKILGYAAPEEPDDWLRIEVDVHHEGSTWKAAHSALFTWDVKDLADFLERIGRRKRKGKDLELGFVEPLLYFVYHTDLQRESFLEVFVGYELYPPWKNRVPDAPDGVWLKFPLSEIDLISAADSLRSQAIRFPRRARHAIRLKNIKVVCLDE